MSAFIRESRQLRFFYYFDFYFGPGIVNKSKAGLCILNLIHFVFLTAFISFTFHLYIFFSSVLYQLAMLLRGHKFKKRAVLALLLPLQTLNPYNYSENFIDCKT